MSDDRDTSRSSLPGDLPTLVLVLEEVRTIRVLFEAGLEQLNVSLASLGKNLDAVRHEQQRLGTANAEIKADLESLRARVTKLENPISDPPEEAAE